MVSKTERNQAIRTAVASGEILKVIAGRYNISIARVSQIIKAQRVNHNTPSLAVCQDTIGTLQTLLTNLNLQVLQLAKE